MDKKIIKFDDTETEEYEFHQYKRPVSINDIDINKIEACNKFTFGKQDFKYLTGYKNSEKVRPSCISFYIYSQTRCLLCILFIRCKLYAAGVISLQFILTMFVIILCICISQF